NLENDSEITNNMGSFIKLYRKLLLELKKLHVKTPSLIEFSFVENETNKKLNLSSGEKALLNLYSSIFNFVLSSQIRSNNWRSFIFLL
ncbi:hypothetical protein, partial [Bacillus sp. SIMBA_005]|uniref:hypothetical protein n=1 Tax=Bacillus sp. SIMBA_005 TaxID=3085754 RepID=UPI00397A4E79